MAGETPECNVRPEFWFRNGLTVNLTGYFRMYDTRRYKFCRTIAGLFRKMRIHPKLFDHPKYRCIIIEYTVTRFCEYADRYKYD